MKNILDHFEILRRLTNKPNFSQRKLANELGFSLGKLNYCLLRLKDKGFLKFKNFSKQKNKVKYMQYVLTPKGISFRTKLTIEFMKKKMREYEELKSELEFNKKKIVDQSKNNNK